MRPVAGRSRAWWSTRLSRAVWRDGTPVELTRREFDLLLFFCEHPYQVFGRGQLLRQVWGYEPLGGDRTVDVHVRRVRTKLRARTPVISTVRGVGYRLAEQAQVSVRRGAAEPPRQGRALRPVHQRL